MFTVDDATATMIAKPTSRQAVDKPSNTVVS